MLLAQVAREAQDWEMRIARLGRVQLLSRFDVVGETTIDQDEYLIRSCICFGTPGPGFPAEPAKTRSFKEAGPRPCAKKESQQEAALEKEKKLQGIIPFLSDSESSHEEHSENESKEASAAATGSQDWLELEPECEDDAAPDRAVSSSAVQQPAAQRP